MRALPTASQLGRAFNCIGSEALHHDASTSEWSAFGTAGHAFVKRAAEIGRDKALAEIEEAAQHFQLCKAIPLDKLPQGGDHEMALAWNHLTDEARELVTNGHRDYSDATPTEFCGTADYVGRGASWVVVIDWKMGYRYLGLARESRQLRMLALAAARYAGVDEARVAYCYLREDGSCAFAWATFDAFDLADIAEELRELAEDLDDQRNEGVPLALHEGEWCELCPAFNSCPAKMKLARAIGTGEAIDSLMRVEREIEAMDDDQLGKVYQLIDLYDQVSERVRKAARTRASMRPFTLPDGRRLGTVQWPYTTINAAVAYEVVAEMHGAAVAEKALPRKATLGKLEELGDETLAEIERRRGILKGTKPQVRPHKP